MIINACRALAIAFAAALGTLAVGASAAETAINSTTAFGAPDVHFTLLDTDGHIVGELVAEQPGQLRLHAIGSTRAATPGTEPRLDRTFHPDFSRALSPGQMQSAWQSELDRLFPPMMAGGG